MIKEPPRSTRPSRGAASVPGRDRLSALGLIVAAAVAVGCEDSSPQANDPMDTGFADSGSSDSGPAFGPMCGNEVVEAPEACDSANGCCALDCAAVRPNATPCAGCTATATTACVGCWEGACLGYVSPCQDILDRMPNAESGVYTISQSVTGTTTIPVLCDMTTRGGGWTMVYKKSAAAVGDASDLWFGPARSATVAEVLNRSRSTLDYVSPYIGALWPAFTEARVEVITGTVAARWIEFDLRDSDSQNWYRPMRVTASDWTDLPTDDTWENGQGRFFSIEGSGPRDFYINNNWGGCQFDRGWIMITRSSFCFWEGRTADFPSEIIYSIGTTLGTAANAETGFADAFIVFVR